MVAKMERLQSIGKAQPIQMAGLYYMYIVMGHPWLHVQYLTINHSGTVVQWILANPNRINSFEFVMELSNIVNMEA